MEPGAQEEVGLPAFRVIWHHEVRKDLEALPSSIVDALVRAVNHRLSRAPQMLGKPLRGTTTLLWRMRFASYRVVYMINAKAREVWVLGVGDRKSVYTNPHIHSLVAMAIAIQQSERRRPPDSTNR